MDTKIYHDEDADLNVLKGKKVAVLGYGAQGRAQALSFRDSGFDVTIGVRENGPSWKKAKEDGGMTVTTMDKAVKDADVVLMLLPDETQPDIAVALYGEKVAHGSWLAPVAEQILLSYYEMDAASEVTAFENQAG